MDQLSATWRKSTYSGGNGGDCVEVARNLPRIVVVRDSKNPGAPSLTLAPDDWRTFTGQVKTGAFDLT
jgi:hypothetical protein